MRLDKFLKISCIFPTRSSAEKAIIKGNVILNDHKTKPSANVRVGDYIIAIFPFKKISYQVLKLLEKNVSKKEAKEMINIISEEKINLF